jgi:glycosyltransferase involved in cell wall biosynthesis
MKLAWLSPFGCGSAIGRFSQAITDELSKHAEVDVWVSSRDDLLPTRLRLVDYNPDLPVNQWWPRGMYDFAVCNLGDHLGFHQRIFEFALRIPSVLILHDVVMHHFFAGYYQLVLRKLEAHLSRIETLYGTAARNANELALAGKATWVWETDRVVEFPMFEDCVAGALGVVTHSRFFADKVREVFSGPVQNIPLAYPADLDMPFTPRKDLAIPQNRALLLTVGNVNRNKRVDEVIEVLAADRQLAASVFYVVCGQLAADTADRLGNLISRSGLQDSVRLNGRTSDGDLRSYFRAADVCINLRNPAMEGGSASLVEMMLYGKAGMVSDTGVYAELPDTCVVKIRPGDERADLGRALARLLADPAMREHVGARARDYADQNCTPGIYARRLLDFLDKASGVKPVLEPVSWTARILADLGVRSDMDIARTIARITADTFCGPTDDAPWNRGPAAK